MEYERTAGGVLLPAPAIIHKFKPGVSWGAHGGSWFPKYQVTNSWNNWDMTAGSGPTYTFANDELRRPHPTRAMIFVVGHRDNSGSCQVSSAKIVQPITTGDDYTCSQMVECLGGNQNCNIEMWGTRLKQGFAGDVVVVYNAANDDVIYAMCSVWGLRSLTPVNTSVASSASAASLSLDLNIAGPGVLVAGVYTATTTSVTWTGVEEIYDFDVSTRHISLAASVLGAAETPRTVTATFSGTETTPRGVAAFFQ